MMLWQVHVTYRFPPWSEAVEALAPTEDEARALGENIAWNASALVIRCRIRRVEMTPEQVQAHVYRWGYSNGSEGLLDIAGHLPRAWRKSYRRGYKLGQSARKQVGG